MIIAEQMFLRCMAEPDLVSDAQRHLAIVYSEQGHFEKSVEMYKAALMQIRDHALAFELAQVFGKMQNFEESLKYFTCAIEMAKKDLINVEPKILAEYFMHRASVYEAVGSMDHS